VSVPGKIIPFDDRKLPVNDLSVERIEELEKIIFPKLKEAFNKLRLEQPHLFKSLSKSE